MSGLALCQAWRTMGEQLSHTEAALRRVSGKDSGRPPTQLKSEGHCQTRLTNYKELFSHFSKTSSYHTTLAPSFRPACGKGTRTLTEGEQKFRRRGIVETKVSRSSFSEFKFRIPLARGATWHRRPESCVSIKTEMETASELALVSMKSVPNKHLGTKKVLIKSTLCLIPNPTCLPINQQRIRSKNEKITSGGLTSWVSNVE